MIRSCAFDACGGTLCIGGGSQGFAVAIRCIVEGRLGGSAITVAAVNALASHAE